MMLLDQVVAPFCILIPYIFADDVLVGETDKLCMKFPETALAVVDPL